MSFLASSKDITLDGSVLKASCLKNDGTTYNDSSLDLNNCLYINSGEGSFDVKTGDYFYELSKNVSLDPNTAILKASLNALDIDKGQYYFDRTFELNLYVGNNDGTLVFNIP
jgi:hypothetical protein